MEIQHRYTLESFHDLIFRGVPNVLPEEVLRTITDLTTKVSGNGSAVTYVKPAATGGKAGSNSNAPIRGSSSTSRKPSASTGGLGKQLPRKAGGASECDWDNVRSAKREAPPPTPPAILQQQKTQLEVVRILLNKLTDKNVADTVAKLEQAIAEAQAKDSQESAADTAGDADTNQQSRAEEMSMMVDRVAALIFDVASNNRFFSKLYAQVYADLAKKYDFLLRTVHDQWAKFMDLFLQIEYVDANEDYDKFCEINKKNERRKSLAAFYVNLVKLSIVGREQMHALMRELLALMYTYVQEDNKKNEVDELTETIAVLYDKTIFRGTDVEVDKIDGMTMDELIDRMAHSKVKDFKSLTSKALFKYMDLVEL